MSQDDVGTFPTHRALDGAIARALGETGRVPHYATEIASANVLVQKMEAKGYTFHTPPDLAGRCTLGFSKGPGLLAEPSLEVEVRGGDRASAVAQAAYRALRHFAPVAP
jgi:hypothetical protein